MVPLIALGDDVLLHFRILLAIRGRLPKRFELCPLGWANKNKSFLSDVISNQNWLLFKLPTSAAALAHFSKLTVEKLTIAQWA
jgi:hypothetical protein